jgi:outer membrane protein TolC
VSVPLFDGLSTGRSIERANVQVDNAQLALEDQRQQVALEVRRAVLARTSAVATAESRRCAGGSCAAGADGD